MSMLQRMTRDGIGPLILALLLTNCGEPLNSAEDTSPEDETTQGAEGFFRPVKGEVWHYRVQKEIPLQVTLTEADRARRPERTESGYLFTFERIRTCNGTRLAKQVNEELTTMEVFEGGERKGEELYDINERGVYTRAWIPQGMDPDRPGVLLKEGVVLATPALQPGQVWKGEGAKGGREFLFRVMEIGPVTVPAGTFEAARIQMAASPDNRGRSLKRTVWFAENVGIVKEEVVSYGPQRTLVREYSELVHRVIPPPEAPRTDELQEAAIKGRLP